MKKEERDTENYPAEYYDDVYDTVIDEIESRRLCEFYDSGHCRLMATYCPLAGQKKYCSYYSENVAQDTRW